MRTSDLSGEQKGLRFSAFGFRNTQEHVCGLTREAYRGILPGMTERQESFQTGCLEKKGGAILRVMGSYGTGCVLMGILLVLTFYGTLFQTRYAHGGNSAAAAEAFFGSNWVLIPLGGENALVALPLPGMWIVCTLLFVNLLIGGIIRASKRVDRWGILLAHAGVLFLFASIALGSWNTSVVEEIRLTPGRAVHVDEMGLDLELIRFSPEFYPGTMKPKSFESELCILDEGRRGPSVHIRMNEPLRSHGWTLYQMSWGEQGGSYVSILRASRNPFEQGPKWASYLIALGLVYHFGLAFVRYVRRSGRVDSPSSTGTVEIPSSPLSLKRKLMFAGLGFFVLAVFGIGMLAGKPPVRTVQIPGYTPWSKNFIEQCEQIAVEEGGRVKPFSTYAGFEMLRCLGKRSLSIATEEGKKSISPTEWAMDCMFRPEYARQFPVFLVNRDEVVSRLGLPDMGEKRKRYSFEQLVPRLTELYRQASAAEKLNKPDDVEKDLIALARNARQVELWMALPALAMASPQGMENSGFPRWLAAEGKWSSVPGVDDGKVLARTSISARQALAMQDSGDRKKLTQDAERIFAEGLIAPNREASASSRQSLEFERIYYRLDPLYLALGCFVGGFVLSLMGLFISPSDRPKRPVWRGLLGRFFSGRGIGGAWYAGVLGVLVLLAGLGLRSLITGRSPVGNTYETIAFIACSGVIVALVMEAIGKKGLFLAAGLVLGFVACQMGIMYEAGQASDHMDPLVAILRSNFLLSTHVITIVLGYAAGLLAAIISHLYLLSRPCGLLDSRTEKMMTRMAYGALCFSLLFTLTGTVFGGIWGNEAWGRFWGWDPKENGALMIVLWQLIVLHARLGGYIRDWGLHFGNVLGGVLIAFAWWGVNMLGVGLHSYGFTQGQDALNVFYGVEAALILLILALKLLSKKQDADSV